MANCLLSNGVVFEGTKKAVNPEADDFINQFRS